MHTNTIVRVQAKNKNDALFLVQELVTSNGSYEQLAPFDWISEDVEISEECKTEEDFNALRLQEIKESERLQQEAKTEKDEWTKGYRLSCAGELLRPDKFWSTERLCYDFAKDEQEGKGKIYFVETDRHS